MNELQAIEQRYLRRNTSLHPSQWALHDPYVMMVDQEKDRALRRWLERSRMIERLSRATLLEIGCGEGANLSRFVRFGFPPQNLVGNDLLSSRLDRARRIVAPGIKLIPGDARQIPVSPAAFDIVCLFTVFSSILDDNFQQQLADHAWKLAKTDGGILWYDFVYDNPWNEDVRGVPLKRIQTLFPNATPLVWRLTLAPPIGRRVSRCSTAIYTFLNLIPSLRTHILAWIPKNAHSAPLSLEPTTTPQSLNNSP